MRIETYIIVMVILFFFVAGVWIGWNLGKPGDDTDFEGKYREAENRIESLEGELGKLGSIIGDLREETERTEGIIERQREVERSLAARLGEYASNNIRLRGIVGILERENTELRERHKDNVGRITAINEGLEELEEFIRSIEKNQPIKSIKDGR